MACSECKRRPRPEENALDEWRAVSDGVGELHIFCPECHEREFADDAPSSRHVIFEDKVSFRPKSVRTKFQFQADVTRAVIQLAIEHEGEPWLDPDAGLDLMPTAGELPTFVEAHGSPLEDAYFASIETAPSESAYRYARRILAADLPPPKDGR